MAKGHDHHIGGDDKSSHLKKAIDHVYDHPKVPVLKDVRAVRGELVGKANQRYQKFDGKDFSTIPEPTNPEAAGLDRHRDMMSVRSSVRKFRKEANKGGN